MKKLFKNTIFIIALALIMILSNSSLSKAATVAPPGTFQEFIDWIRNGDQRYLDVDAEAVIKKSYRGEYGDNNTLAGNWNETWANCLRNNKNGSDPGPVRISAIIDVSGNGNVTVYGPNGHKDFKYENYKGKNSRELQAIRSIYNLAYVYANFGSFGYEGVNGLFHYTVLTYNDILGINYTGADSRHANNVNSVPTINGLNPNMSAGITHSIGNGRKARITIVEGSGIQDKILFGIGNDTRKPELKIEKVDSINSNIKIEGAGFRIYEVKSGNADWNTYHNDKNYIKYVETGKNGVALFDGDGLEEGKKYAIIEVKTPANYAKSTEVYITKPLESGVNTFQFKNTPNSVKIVKKDKNSGKLLSGANFWVCNPKYNGNNIITDFSKYSESDRVGKILTTGDNGEIILRNSKLEVGKPYIVFESKSPKGYSKDEVNFRIINPLKAGINTVEFENYKTSIQIKKTDASTKKALKGASFWICNAIYENGEYSKDEAKYRAKGVEATIGGAAVTTDEDGTFILNNTSSLHIGKYYAIFESEAPSGYKRDSKVEIIKLHKGVNTVQFTNEQITTNSVQIRKIDADTKMPLAGATFWICNAISENGEYSRDEAKYRANANSRIGNPVVTQGDGTFTLDSSVLKVDNYYAIFESEAPNGYRRDPKVEIIKLSKGVNTVEFTNEPIIKASLKIIKVDKKDQNKKLANVTFKIQYKEDSTYVRRDANGNITYVDEKDATEFVTDKNGEILINDLIVGRYGILETKNNNEGYEPDGKEDIVDIKQNENGLYTFTKTNELKYIKLSGYVWLDKKPEQKETSELPNGLYKEDGFDINDQLLANIPVRLMYKGNKEAETKTDGNGAYLFEKVDVNKLEDYYVEFEYDGFTYENSAVNLNKNNGSKASEGDSRKAFNNGFYAIEGTGETTGVAKNSKGETTHNIDYNKNRNEYKSEYTRISDTLIIANTKNATLNLKEKWSVGTTEIKNINLGLQERKQADLAIIKDIVNAKATINGYEHTYKYGKAMRAKEDQKYSGEGFNVAVRFGKESGDINEPYTRAIYPSDVNYTPENADNELKLYITYAVGIKNKTTDLNAKVYSIADYYDSRYTIVKAGKSIDDSGKITSELTQSIKSEPGIGKYSKAIIDTANLNVDGGTTSYLYIQFQLNREAILAVLDKDGELLENVIEINSYGSYDKKGNIYAAIDKNSNPGNVVPGNLSTYEDDVDIAPALKLVTTNAREISGTVFVDESGVKDGIREGDGELTDKDTKRLANIPVKLESVSGKNKGFTRNVQTDENGNFTISDFIPDEYTITYNWGNEKYSSKDYKATIFVNPDRASTTDWFNKDSEHRYSDAMDDWNTRISIDNGEKEQKEIFAVTPLMAVPIENDPKAALTTDSRGDIYKYTVKDVDFGITKRPEQEMQIGKKVKAVKITLPNGEVLTDATVGDDGKLNGQIKGLTRLENAWVKVEMDNELIQGSTAEIKYEITATNNSERDYYSQDFYNYGYTYANNIGALNDDNIVKINVKKVIDYLDEGLVNLDDGWKTTEKVNMGADGIEDKRIKLEADRNDLIKPGDKLSGLILNSSKLLSLNGILEFDNTAELNQLIARPNLETIYGKQPKKVGEANRAKAEQVTITNSTGENRDNILAISIGIGTLTIIAAAIIWTKKKISSNK